MINQPLLNSNNEPGITTYTRSKTLMFPLQLLIIDIATVPLTVESLAGAVIVTVQGSDCALAAAAANTGNTRPRHAATKRLISFGIFLSCGRLAAILLWHCDSDYRATGSGNVWINLLDKLSGASVSQLATPRLDAKS
jgi:hypothetical protein